MNAIELHQAQKRYSDFTLGPITFSLPAGCILGLVGENGAGKTTTIKLLLNLIRRDGGSVQVLGKDPAQSGPALKEDLGVVLDEVGFPDCITPRPAGPGAALHLRPLGFRPVSFFAAPVPAAGEKALFRFFQRNEDETGPGRRPEP